MTAPKLDAMITLRQLRAAWKASRKVLLLRKTVTWTDKGPRPFMQRIPLAKTKKNAADFLWPAFRADTRSPIGRFGEYDRATKTLYLQPIIPSDADR